MIGATLKQQDDAERAARVAGGYRELVHDLHRAPAPPVTPAVQGDTRIRVRLNSQTGEVRIVR